MYEVIIWVILTLTAITVIALYMIASRQMRMQGQADSQSRQFDQVKEQQLQSREAQLKGLAEMQAKLEQRFGDMQHGIEKRLGEMSQSSIERMAKSNEQIQELSLIHI